MPTDTTSPYDDNYLAKFTADEVGADIETHGHVAVTPETATQDPFTQKGSLANALDGLLESSEADTLPEAITQTHTVNHNPELREVATGELTGETEGVEMGESKMVGEDEAVSVKDSLAAAFDEAFAMDGVEGGELSEADEQAHEEWLKKSLKAPELPKSLKDKEKPDGNGLVYITRTFKLDPTKYISPNYRPIAATPKVIQQPTVGGDVVLKEEMTLEEKSSPDAKISANSPDEPSKSQETNAAKEAEKIQAGKGKEEISVEETVKDKTAQDEEVSHDYSVGRWVAFPNVRMSGRVRKITGKPESNCNGRYAYPCESPDLDNSNHFKNLYLSLYGVRSFATRKEAEEFLESKSKSLDDSQKKVEDGGDESIVFDYAEFIDGSSFCCFDEESGIDYTKITMDAGPRKKVTRENCETTFAQCRAKNPLFCRFHGPKLLEKDIQRTVRAFVGLNVIVSVTKDKDAKDPMTFRLTVGCAPVQKKKVEMALDNWLNDCPGITRKGSNLDTIDDRHYTQELNMDILRADQPPRKDTHASQAEFDRDNSKKYNLTMPVVGETPENITEKLNKGNAGGKAEAPAAAPVAQEEVKEKVEEKVEPPAETAPEAEEPEEEVKEETTENIEPAKEEPPAPEPTKEPAKAPEAKAGTSTLKPKKKNPYSYEAYGDIPNEDPATNELEPGGTGDILGAELLRYASENDGLLKLPKNWGKYSAALARWERANKTGGMYHGRPATKLNRPTMSAFGIVDPMSDWIDSMLNGGLRQKDRGTFIALFGRKPHEGGNDAILDDAPDEVRAYLEQHGPEAVAEAFLKARDAYADWSAKAREAARKRKAAQNKGRFNADDILSLDEIEARNAADKEYNEAFAEVERYENGSETIRNFSREQMKNLKGKDIIRFNHSDAEFIVEDYDADNDVLSVHPLMGFEENTERYRVTPDGIERIYDEQEPQTQNQGGEPENEPETENGTAKTVAGNAESQTSGEEPEPTAEPAGTEEPAAEREIAAQPDKAQIENAADAMSAEVGIGVDAIKEGLQNRLDGKEKIEPDVMSLVDRTLPKGDPVREALEKKAESEGQEDLSLESVSPEQLQKEERRSRERAEMERLLAKPIKGGKTEENQSLFDLGGQEGEDLFNRVQTTAHNALAGDSSPEMREVAEEARDAATEAQSHEATAAELDDFLSEMEADLVGGDGAIIESAIEDAIDGEDKSAEKATARAEKGLKELNRLYAESFKTAEKTAKGEAAAKVEHSLTNLAKMIFPANSKNDSIGEEAESIADSVAAYAKEKDVDYELDTPVRDVIDDIKKDSERLEGLMSDFRNSMEAEGTDFHDEDIRHLTGAIGRLSMEVANKFSLLKAMGKVEKNRIDNAKKLKDVKDELLKGTEEETSEQEQAETKGQESEEPQEEQKKETETAKPKDEKPEKARDAGDMEKRKAAILASRRLGVDAYKPDDVLEKMLETAKAHMSDPRQAQRAKDIETILADRKTKGKHEVTQEEKESSRAERRFKNRASDTEMLPSESFKNIKRDNTEGLGNQLNDDWEPSKEEINAEDAMPEKAKETNAEIVARIVVQALEGDK